MLQIDYHILIITLCFIVFDFFSGFAKAAVLHKIDSTVMREGLYHKLALIALVALAMLLDYGQTYIELGFEVPVTIGVCVYIILMELVSSLENIAVMNPALQASALMKLFKIKDKDQPEKEDENDA